MIRECRECDFDTICTIVNDAAIAYRGVIPEDRWHEPYMSKAELREAIDQGVMFWGVEQDGHLVGVMGIQPVRDVTLIRHAYVRTAYRRQGIGSRLLAFLLDRADRPVLIGTWAAADWAVRFYQKHGFRLVPAQVKNRLLRTYWGVPERQVETSVVLADAKWRDGTNDNPRSYWASQLDEASEFMDRITAYAVKDCGEPLADLVSAVAAADLRVTFSETEIAPGLKRIFMLREGLVPNFLAVARRMNDLGWELRVEDGYRTRAMQRALSLAPYVLDKILAKVTWELDEQMPSQDLLFKRVRVLTATCPKIGTHMSGSAVDISVFDSDTGLEVDRGAPYLEMSEKTPMASPYVSQTAHANRMAITRIFELAGFVAYPYEFWHYSRGDAYDELMAGSGRPGRYGAVDIDSTGAVTPITDPTASLHSPESFAQAMQQSLNRR